MKSLDDLSWQQTCCAWDGQYAEALTKQGGVARIKRKPDEDGGVALWVCRFGPDNVALDMNAGEPAYVQVAEVDLLNTLA